MRYMWDCAGTIVSCSEGVAMLSGACMLSKSVGDYCT
jgi:hypothetical protein